MNNYWKELNKQINTLNCRKKLIKIKLTQKNILKAYAKNLILNNENYEFFILFVIYNFIIENIKIFYIIKF